MKALILLAVLASSPLAAQAVKDTPAVTLDPAKAYIFYEANKFGTAVKLIRDATDKDRADYAADRTKAFDKAVKRYERNHAEWVALGRVPNSRRGPEPQRPEDKTFAIEPIEMRLMVDIGPFNRFTKEGDTSSYLHAVEPGGYRVYGPITLNPQGGAMMGTCLCMGTVRFDAAAGSITDLGSVRLPFFEAHEAAKTGASAKPKNPLDLPPGKTSFMLDPAKPGDTVDPRVASFPVKPAIYTATGRIPNFYGLEIDRLTAIPGVLRYERDKIIDDRTGQQIK